MLWTFRPVDLLNSHPQAGIVVCQVVDAVQHPVRYVAAVREHRQRQLAERLLMGAGFTDHGLVFCRPDGGPLHPERFSRTFTIEAARAGMPAIRLHDLRHTWATLALSAGEHPKVVQERLGHAAIAITLDVYSHVTEGLHGDAASRVAGIIFGAPAVSTPLATAGDGDHE
jgi:integrase